MFTEQLVDFAVVRGWCDAVAAVAVVVAGILFGLVGEHFISLCFYDEL